MMINRTPLQGLLDTTEACASDSNLESETKGEQQKQAKGSKKLKLQARAKVTLRLEGRSEELTKNAAGHKFTLKLPGGKQKKILFGL
jgi:hypothetical protein